MPPALERRLNRLTADLLQAETAATAHRSSLRALVEVGGKLRQMLAERGVDPADVAALFVVERAAAELATLPDSAAARSAEAAWLAERQAHDQGGFAGQLARMALLHFADGQLPDPARASLMEWHAWCLMTPASRHEPPLLADPAVRLHQRMLRLGSGDPAWR